MKRFGVFELDVDRAELRKHGLRIKLQDQPLQVLALLLEKPGEVVTREELRRRLWPADTFVDFDNGLNAAVNKVREALNDMRANPRFVETVPRRGYRFVAPVQTALPPTAEAALPPWTMMASGSTAAPGLTDLPRIPAAPRASQKNWTLLILTAALLSLKERLRSDKKPPGTLPRTASAFNPSKGSGDGFVGASLFIEPESCVKRF